MTPGLSNSTASVPSDRPVVTPTNSASRRRLRSLTSTAAATIPVKSPASGLPRTLTTVARAASHGCRVVSASTASIAAARPTRKVIRPPNRLISTVAANTMLAARGRAEPRSSRCATHMQIAEATAPVVATPIVAIRPGARTEYVGSSTPPYQPGHHVAGPSWWNTAARVAWAAKSGTGGTRIR